MLLKEEMRWALAYLEWKQSWWRERQLTRPNISKDLQEGISAYVVLQADIQGSLAAHFMGLWKAPLQDTDTTGEANNERSANSDDGDDNDNDDDNGDGDIKEKMGNDDFDEDS